MRPTVRHVARASARSNRGPRAPATDGWDATRPHGTLEHLADAPRRQKFFEKAEGFLERCSQMLAMATPRKYPLRAINLRLYSGGLDRPPAPAFQSAQPLHPSEYAVGMRAGFDWTCRGCVGISGGLAAGLHLPVAQYFLLAKMRRRTKNSGPNP